MQNILPFFLIKIKAKLQSVACFQKFFSAISRSTFAQILTKYTVSFKSTLSFNIYTANMSICFLPRNCLTPSLSIANAYRRIFDNFSVFYLHFTFSTTASQRAALLRSRHMQNKQKMTIFLPLL